MILPNMELESGPAKRCEHGHENAERPAFTRLRAVTIPNQYTTLNDSCLLIC
ncbi:MAG: hypothetical protein U0350_34190 [Caldilineaceae bacterium]